MGRFKTGRFEIVDEPVCRLQPPAAERKSVDVAPFFLGCHDALVVDTSPKTIVTRYLKKVSAE